MGRLRLRPLPVLAGVWVLAASLVFSAAGSVASAASSPMPSASGDVFVASVDDLPFTVPVLDNDQVPGRSAAAALKVETVELPAGITVDVVGADVVVDVVDRDAVLDVPAFGVSVSGWYEVCVLAGCSSATWVVQLFPSNEPPTARDDTGPDVAGNDSYSCQPQPAGRLGQFDPFGACRFEPLVAPTFGVLEPDGTYLPDPNSAGELESFTYQVVDPFGASTALVEFEVPELVTPAEMSARVTDETARLDLVSAFAATGAPVGDVAVTLHTAFDAPALTETSDSNGVFTVDDGVVVFTPTVSFFDAFVAEHAASLPDPSPRWGARSPLPTDGASAWVKVCDEVRCLAPAPLTVWVEAPSGVEPVDDQLWVLAPNMSATIPWLSNDASLVCENEPVCEQAFVARVLQAPKHGTLTLAADAVGDLLPYGNDLYQAGTVSVQDRFRPIGDGTMPLDGSAVLVNARSANALTYTVGAPSSSVRSDVAVIELCPVGFYFEDFTVWGVPNGCATSVLNVKIRHRPGAVNDSVQADSTVTVPVLSNDMFSDVDGFPATVKVVTNPKKGKATVTKSRDIRYRPDAGVTGSDSFRYEVRDVYGSSSASVLVQLPAPLKAVPPSVPRSFSVDHKGSRFVYSWRPPANVGGAPVTSYTLVTVDGKRRVLEPGVEFSHRGKLKPETTYKARLRATNAAGVSTWTVYEFTTAPGKSSQPPRPSAPPSSNADGRPPAAGQLVDMPARGQGPSVSDEEALSNLSRAVDDNVEVAPAGRTAVEVLDNDVLTDGRSWDRSSLQVTPPPSTELEVEVVDGVLFVTPVSGFSGVSTIGYSVTDSQGLVSSATVTVVVAGDVREAVVDVPLVAGNTTVGSAADIGASPQVQTLQPPQLETYSPSLLESLAKWVPVLLALIGGAVGVAIVIKLRQR